MVRVIFEDPSFLVLDKPPFLVTTSSETNKGPSLEDILKTDYHIDVERGGIVHRLDKNTSGILVVAKTREALENLQAQFKGRAVKKEYLALVHGRVERAGKVEVAIMRNPSNREKFIAVGSQATLGVAREAVTEYEPLKKFKIQNSKFKIVFEEFNKIQMRKLLTTHYSLFTLLKCHPLTGRTHQIRVHLKYINHPVAGDDKYGGRRITRLDRRFCPRQFLHAAKLEFNHPETGERLKFESPLPEDLKKVLGFLEEV